MNNFWLNVSPKEGEGDSVVTNTVEEHDGRVKRNTVVVAVAETVSAAASYNVIQEPKSEYIVLNSSVITVQGSGDKIIISGRSNAPKLTFSVSDEEKIDFELIPVYKVNGLEAVNGQLIQYDPGSTAMYVFEFTVNVPRNTGYARSGKIFISGESYEVTATVNQNIAENLISFKRGSFIKSVSINSKNVEFGGSVSCTAVVIQNTTHENYSFDGWYSDGVKVSNSLTLNLTNVIASKTYTAEAIRDVKSYVLTITPSPILGGTVVGGGTYPHGTLVTSTAVASEGYVFEKWVGSDGTTSTANPFVRGWDIVDNINVTAIFKVRAYEVTTDSKYRSWSDDEYIIGEVGGSAVGGGTFDYGSSVTITATPTTNYSFTAWVLDGVSVSNLTTYTFPCKGNMKLVAAFDEGQCSLLEYLPYSKIKGYGSYELDYNSGITMLESSYGGVPFVSGNVMNFIGKKFPSGSIIKLTLKPSRGYEFFSWAIPGVPGAGIDFYVNPITFTVGDLDFKIWNYALLPLFTVNFNYDSDSVASVSRDVGVITYKEQTTSDAYQNSPKYGVPVWNKISGDCTVSVNNPSVTILSATSDVVMMATAMINTFNVQFTKNENIGTISKVSQVVDYDETATCEATLPINTPETIFTFDGWYNGTTLISNNLLLSIPNITSDVTIQARGIRANQVYEIIVIGGTGSGSYIYGTELVITATPAESHKFTEWNDGDTSATRTVTVLENKTYTASFKIKEFKILAVKNPATASTSHILQISPESQDVQWGQNGQDIVVTLSDRYKVDKWINSTTGGVVAVDVNTLKIENVRSSIKYFISDRSTGYEVSVTNRFTNDDQRPPLIPVYTDGDTGGVGVSNTSLVEPDGFCTLTATPSTGYEFSFWAANGITVSTDLEFVTSITTDTIFTANFRKKWFSVHFIENLSFPEMLSFGLDDRNIYGGIIGGGVCTFLNGETITFAYGNRIMSDGTSTAFLYKFSKSILKWSVMKSWAGKTIRKAVYYKTFQGHNILYICGDGLFSLSLDGVTFEDVELSEKIDISDICQITFNNDPTTPGSKVMIPLICNQQRILFIDGSEEITTEAKVSSILSIDEVGLTHTLSYIDIYNRVYYWDVVPIQEISEIKWTYLTTFDSGEPFTAVNFLRYFRSAVVGILPDISSIIMYSEPSQLKIKINDVMVLRDVFIETEEGVLMSGIDYRRTLGKNNVSVLLSADGAVQSKFNPSFMTGVFELDMSSPEQTLIAELYVGGNSCSIKVQGFDLANISGIKTISHQHPVRVPYGGSTGNCSITLEESSSSSISWRVFEGSATIAVMGEGYNVTVENVTSDAIITVMAPI